MLPLPITLPEFPKLKLLLPLHYCKTLFVGREKGTALLSTLCGMLIPVSYASHNILMK